MNPLGVAAWGGHTATAAADFAVPRIRMLCFVSGVMLWYGRLGSCLLTRVWQTDTRAAREPVGVSDSFSLDDHTGASCSRRRIRGRREERRCRTRARESRAWW